MEVNEKERERGKLKILENAIKRDEDMEEA